MLHEYTAKLGCEPMTMFCRARALSQKLHDYFEINR
jgi:hypothetical protein